MKRSTVTFLAVVAMASMLRSGDGLIWRHLYGWQLKDRTSKANLTYVLDKVTTWPKLAPKSCGILGNYASATDLSGGLPGPNTSAAYTTADISGFIEFATLDGIACYFAWLRPRSDYAATVPLLGLSARMQQVDGDTTPDNTYVYLSISRFPTLACGANNYSAPSNVVGLAVANMYNLTQLAPTSADGGMISADLGLNPILYPDLPPNWNWGNFLLFNAAANMTGFLTYLGTQSAYLTVLNATQNQMSFSFLINYSGSNGSGNSTMM